MGLNPIENPKSSLFATKDVKKAASVNEAEAVGVGKLWEPAQGQGWRPRSSTSESAFLLKVVPSSSVKLSVEACVLTF